MPTVYEAAQMANAVYGDKPNVPGWTCVDSRKGGILNGFQAAAFVKDGVTVVAFRGTNYSGTGLGGDIRGGLMSDAGADLKLGAGMNSTYFADGEAYMFAYRHLPRVYVCGHSLGGAIAQVVGNRQGLKFATFNAPGVAVVASRNISSATVGMTAVRTLGMTLSAVRHPMQAIRDMRAAFNTAHGLNLCLTHDRISKVGIHYGEILRIPGLSTNWLDEHGMDTVLKVLKGRSTAIGALDIAGF
ncbi:MAG TPA: hypothetical protein VGM25_02180 [Caulobacteraceae bacterium]